MKNQEMVGDEKYCKNYALHLWQELRTQRRKTLLHLCMRHNPPKKHDVHHRNITRIQHKRWSGMNKSTLNFISGLILGMLAVIIFEYSKFLYFTVVIPQAIIIYLLINHNLPHQKRKGGRG
jgi:hypothetical protein